MKLRNRTQMYCILILLVTFSLLTSCGSKEGNADAKTQEEATTNSDEILEEDPVFAAIMENKDAFFKEYMGYNNENELQNSPYLLQEQEDAKDMEGIVHDADLDDTWEGYNVVELGLLTPEQMPNCQTEASGMHFVVYDKVVYIYVNDLSNKENTIYAEYADVWCTIGSPAEIRVLGDLEEYGKHRAKEGDNVE